MILPFQRVASLGLDVCVYFNNNIGGYALEDAMTLRKLLDAG